MTTNNLNEVWMSDVWVDKDGKYWRVMKAHRTEGDVTIMRCAKLTGMTHGGEEKTVSRETFMTEYQYEAHANL